MWDFQHRPRYPFLKSLGKQLDSDSPNPREGNGIKKVTEIERERERKREIDGERKGPKTLNAKKNEARGGREKATCQNKREIQKREAALAMIEVAKANLDKMRPE